MKIQTSLMLADAILFLILNIFASCRDCELLTIEKLDKIFKNKQYIADSFTYPLGNNAHGYYNAQKFGKRNRNFSNNKHLGEDWNGVKGGNSDLGDPVYAIADGYIFYAGTGGSGWGDVIRIIHKLPDGGSYKYIESLYGHVIDIKVSKGSFVKKGQLIGRIGNVNGLYYAHLHIELRNTLNMPVGGGYGENTGGFLSFTNFLKEHK